MQHCARPNARQRAYAAANAARTLVVAMAHGISSCSSRAGQQTRRASVAAASRCNAPPAALFARPYLWPISRAQMQARPALDPTSPTALRLPFVSGRVDRLFKKSKRSTSQAQTSRAAVMPLGRFYFAARVPVGAGGRMRSHSALARPTGGASPAAHRSRPLRLGRTHHVTPPWSSLWPC